MRCLITGSSGFIGKSLAPHLHRLHHDTINWPRNAIFDFENPEPSLNEWISQLHNVDVIIHLAGLAHQRSTVGEEERYFHINRDGTLHLANAAQAAGVKRFIFLSSAKVFGEGGNVIYSNSTIPAPKDAYAISKWEAEQQLLDRFASSMEIIILRPPLVYGPEAKANFASLMKLAKLPIPLPFAGIENRRAMIGIDNLIDLITRCLTSHEAVGKTLACADPQHYSLSDIITAMRHVLGRPPHLVRIPRPIVAALKYALGNSVSTRLFGDFQMDCSETYQSLKWKPPLSMEQILSREAES